MIRVSKDLEKHIKRESVFRHRSHIVRPEEEQKSILEWERRDEVPHSWNRRVSPGFTFSNVELPDPDYDSLIRNLQSHEHIVEQRVTVVEGDVAFVEREVDYIFETYKKIISLPADGFGRPNVNPPTVVTQDNISLYRFTLNTDSMYFKFPVPADYHSGDIELGPVWTNDGGNDDNGRGVRWQTRYQTAAEGLRVDGTLGTLNSDDVYAGAVGWLEFHAPYVSVPAAHFLNRECIYVRLMAVTPPGAALTCEPHLIGVCLRWTARRIV